MAEAQLESVDQSSANVKFLLTDSNEEEYRRNPIYLHSRNLKRSKLFELEVFEGSSSDKPIEICLTNPENFDHHFKCIELMDGESVHFSSIEECLAILSIVSEMLADDCIEKCMEYLEAVRWSAEEETQIRNALSSLELKLLPDLAARLHQEDDNHIIFVERSMEEIVSFIKCGDSSLSSQKTVEIYLMGMLEGNIYRDVMDVCGRVLLREFKSAMESCDLSSLVTLFQLIQQCEGETVKAAMAFCDDSQFTQFSKQQNKYHYGS